MTEELPEADALEQSTPVRPGGQDLPVGPVPVEAPEGDYLEQLTPASPDESRFVPTSDVEASEADLLEQAEGVADDDEEYPPVGGGQEFEE